MMRRKKNEARRLWRREEERKSGREKREGKRERGNRRIMDRRKNGKEGRARAHTRRELRGLARKILEGRASTKAYREEKIREGVEWRERKKLIGNRSKGS
jgi:hypothetical protein